jgi:hypothetical protein
MIKAVARPIGYLALLGTIVPPLLFMFHKIELTPMQGIMLVSCIAWFVAAPLWMKTE